MRKNEIRLNLPASWRTPCLWIIVVLLAIILITLAIFGLIVIPSRILSDDATPTPIAVLIFGYWKGNVV